jgi:hypothetical protein
VAPIGAALPVEAMAHLGQHHPRRLDPGNGILPSSKAT